MQTQTEQPYVAVIGASNIDIMGTMTGEAISGDSNPGKLQTSSGGVARNIAENLAHLGTATELISAFGNDGWSDLITQHCKALGIGISHSVLDPNMRTSSYLSVHDKSGELITAISDMAILDGLNAETLSERLQVLQAAACWVIDANLSADALEFLFSCSAKIPIFIDPVSVTKAQRLRPYLSKIHCITPNLQEASMLSGVAADTYHQAPEVATELHKKGVSNVMITLGKQGAFASDGRSEHWLAAEASEVVNVTGCGDAACAALVHGFVSGVPWHTSCELAMSAAALTASSSDSNTHLLGKLGKHP